jgi:hypothetical protein
MQFKTVKEFLAQTGKDAPLAAEEKLIKACRAGQPCILSETRPTSGTDANTLRAPLLRMLILGGTAECGLHERGVTVKGAWITGTLDLAYCTARGQTALDDCHFVEEPSFPSAKLNLLSLQRSHLPGLFAQGMEVSSSVFLRNLTATGTVAVNSAKIGGQLDCTGANLNGAGGKGAERPRGGNRAKHFSEQPDRHGHGRCERRQDRRAACMHRGHPERRRR